MLNLKRGHTPCVIDGKKQEHDVDNSHELSRLFTPAQASRRAPGMESPSVAHEPCSAPAALLCVGAAAVASTADCGRTSRVAGGAAWREQASSPLATPTTDPRRQSRAAYCKSGDHANPETSRPSGNV